MALTFFGAKLIILSGLQLFLDKNENAPTAQQNVNMNRWTLLKVSLVAAVLALVAASAAKQTPSGAARFAGLSTPTPSTTRPRRVAATIPGGTPSLGPGASLHGKQVFPADNPWNQDISTAPVDPNSARLIAAIGADDRLHPDFGTVYRGAPNGIPYIVVGGSQPKVRVDLTAYASESDPGPYPIPRDAPIEGGPNSEGDRHVLVIDRDNWKLYELFAARPNPTGTIWSARGGAIFDLKSNEMRPDGWTSADAAGLPIFPGLVRYDEVFELREIRHALRFTVKRSRRAYLYPARHHAGHDDDPNLPPMGLRVRLKASFDISSFSPSNQVILRALKKYGMFVADNGPSWFLSGAPDPRWSDDDLGNLKSIKGFNFEVVKMGTIITK